MRIRVLFPFLTLAFLITTIISNTSYTQEFHGGVAIPSYNGGLKALKEFIVKNNQCNDMAIKGGTTGIVTVGYIINENGKIENIKILRGLNPKCDSEAVRITRLINGWQAGVQWGKTIRMQVAMPIEFNIKPDTQKDTAVVVSGYVWDKGNGKPVAGTLVIVKGTNIGAVTDNTGLYSISLPGQDYELEYNSLGYGIKSEKVGMNHFINVELIPENFNIDFSAN